MSCFLFLYTNIGAVIGVTNLGELNSHLSAFEKALKDDAIRQPPQLANSMLVILVRGLFSRLQFPYAQFPCTALSGDQMYEPIWEAISRLELCGFKVLALTCDGLAANRKLFRLHVPGSKSMVYKVANPFASDGCQLYFFVDPPHLIKTVRNGWANPKRQLWVSLCLRSIDLSQFGRLSHVRVHMHACIVSHSII